MLALMCIAGGEGRIINVRAKRHPARGHFREVGIGHFGRYEPRHGLDPERRTIYSDFLSLEGA